MIRAVAAHGGGMLVRGRSDSTGRLGWLQKKLCRVSGPFRALMTCLHTCWPVRVSGQSRVLQVFTAATWRTVCAELEESPCDCCLRPAGVSKVILRRPAVGRTQAVVTVADWLLFIWAPTGLLNIRCWQPPRCLTSLVRAQSKGPDTLRDMACLGASQARTLDASIQ